MAKTPEKLLALTEAEEKLVDDVERFLDSELDKIARDIGFDSNDLADGVRVPIGEFINERRVSPPNKMLIAEVIRRFERAGWSRVVYNPEDLSFLFSTDDLLLHAAV
jgi:hypothetical protein